MAKTQKCKGKHIPWNRIENSPNWKEPFTLTFSINCKKNDWAIIVDCDCHTDPKSLLYHWHDDSFIFSFFSRRSKGLIFLVTQERGSFFPWPKKEAQKELTPSFMHWYNPSWPKEGKKKKKTTSLILSPIALAHPIFNRLCPLTSTKKKLIFTLFLYF